MRVAALAQFRARRDSTLGTKADEGWFCIAGLWRPVDGVAPVFTMLTCEPGPDVSPIHDRQIVVLDRNKWAAWLDPQSDEAELLKPSAAGSLNVAKVERRRGKQVA
jgi:putative SOS response-associated peptidase YedK